MNAWYILHVRTGEETDVLAVLRRNLPQSKGIVPQRTLRESRNGKWKTVIRTIFPGYVFVYLELFVEMKIDAPVFYKLSGIPGVIRILGNDCTPSPVPDDEMRIVLMLAGDGDPIGMSEVFIEGGKVRVKSGVLQGLEGQIIKVDVRRFRAKVNISLMGEPRIVELGVNVIEKI